MVTYTFEDEQPQGETYSLEPQEKTPEWAGRHPNTYAAANTALDLLPMAANFAKSSGIGIPVAGALNVAGQAAKRALNQEDDVFDKALSSFLIGSVGQAGGDLIQKGILPAIGRAIPESWIKSFYGQAIKPRTQLTQKERMGMLTQGLDDKILPTYDGLDTLRNLGDATSDQIDDIIRGGTATGDTIPRSTVVNEFGQGKTPMTEAARRLSKQDPSVKGSLIERLLSLKKEGTEIPVDQAQFLKRHFQSQASYPKDTRGMYDEQIDQATARGFRKALEDKYPELKGLNETQQNRILLEKQLIEGGTIGRIENRDVVGLPMTVAAAAPGATNTAIGAGTLAARTLLNFPKMTAKTAIKMYEAKTGVKLPPSKWKQAAAYLMEAAVLGTGNEMNNPRNEPVIDDPLGLYNAE